MVEFLTIMLWGIIAIMVVSGLLSLIKWRGQETCQILAIMSVILIVLFVCYLLPNARHQQARDLSIPCVAGRVGVPLPAVSLDGDVCESNTWGSCVTWKANYRAPGKFGTVSFSVERNSCVLTP